MEKIAEESILQFLKREGSVSTYSVATRFGMSLPDARKALNALARKGEVEKQLQRFNSPHCAMYGWRLAPAHDDAELEPEMQLVWVQNLIGFVKGQFPADETWKAIFVKQLEALTPAPKRKKPLVDEVD